MPDSNYSLSDLAAPHVWGTERILPEGFLPMLPTSANAALDSADHAYEVKWEGMRTLVGLEGPRLVLRTGTGQDPHFWFPELAGIRAAAEPAWVLLDGEILVMEGGRPSPRLLQQRLRATDESQVRALAAQHPAQYVAYDLLRIGDSWLLDVTWEERREILTRAVGANETLRRSLVARDGALALTHARDLGLDGIMAKRLKGRYVPGEKTRDWLSVRPAEELELVIGGWTEGRGARSESIGTLLLGVPRGSRLEYVGHTGTGIDAETLRTLHDDLLHRVQRECPFHTPPPVAGVPRWVRPELRCRVRCAGWNEGRMRSATFLGMVRPGAVPTGER